jgi:hypothetical protein
MPALANDNVLLWDHCEVFAVFRESGILHLRLTAGASGRLIECDVLLDKRGIRIALGGKQDALFLLLLFLVPVFGRI